MKVKQLTAWLAGREPDDEIDVELTIHPRDGRWHWLAFMPITELAPDLNSLAVDIDASSIYMADLHETLNWDCDCHVKGSSDAA